MGPGPSHAALSPRPLLTHGQCFPLPAVPSAQHALRQSPAFPDKLLLIFLCWLTCYLLNEARPSPTVLLYSPRFPGHSSHYCNLFESISLHWIQKLHEELHLVCLSHPRSQTGPLGTLGKVGLLMSTPGWGLEESRGRCPSLDHLLTYPFLHLFLIDAHLFCLYSALPVSGRVLTAFLTLCCSLYIL